MLHLDEWWLMERKGEIPHVPWKESPKQKEMPSQGGQAAGEAGQHSAVLLSDLGGSSRALSSVCAACSLPSSRKTFPAWLGARAQSGAAAFVFRAV